jgi:hypothetical protein
MVKSEYEFALIYAAALAWLDLALAGPTALDAASAAITTRWRPMVAGDEPSAEGRESWTDTDFREEAEAMNLRDVSQYGGRKMKRSRRYTKGTEKGVGEREQP